MGSGNGSGKEEAVPEMKEKVQRSPVNRKFRGTDSFKVSHFGSLAIRGLY